MKRHTRRRLLYLFSFSLLFVALYLNFLRKEKNDLPVIKTGTNFSVANPTTAVALPDNNTVLK